MVFRFINYSRTFVFYSCKFVVNHFSKIIVKKETPAMHEILNNYHVDDSPMGYVP